MRRFYNYTASKMCYFGWGRTVVYHIRRHKTIYENVEALYTALILALLIKAFLFDAYEIPSGSMKDTLMINDRIFVNKFIYKFEDIDVGDIIVFKTKGIPKIENPEKPYFIKRVVGLPEDTLEIGKDGFLYRNGKKIVEPPIFLENRYFPFREHSPQKFTVPDGHLMVFGDNSRDSYDSRGWGYVPIENVVGRAMFRYWPLSRIGLIKGVPPELIRAEVARERQEKRSSATNAQAAEQ